MSPRAICSDRLNELYSLCSLIHAVCVTFHLSLVLQPFMSCPHASEKCNDHSMGVIDVWFIADQLKFTKRA